MADSVTSVLEISWSLSCPTCFLRYGDQELKNGGVEKQSWKSSQNTRAARRIVIS